MYLAASRKFDEVIVWEQRDEKGNHRVKRYNAPYQCFITAHDWRTATAEFRLSVEEGEPDNGLKEFIAATRDAIDTKEPYKSMYGDKLYKVSFSNGKQWRNFVGKVPAHIRLWESDIPPELKVLSEHYYKAEDPKIRTTFYDIEVDYSPERGFSSTTDPYAPINSIAFYHTWEDHYVVIAVPPRSWRGKDPEKLFDYGLFDDIKSKYTVRFVQNEAELLVAAVQEIQECDLMSGWNSALFDDPYFAQRVEIVLGEDWFQMLSFPGGKKPYYRDVEIMFRMQKQVSFDGRITIDYMELFKKFTVEDRDSWNLESVSADHLGDRFKKLDYEGTLNDLYNNNFSKFVRYNLRDTEILKELDGKYKFIALGNKLIHQSTCHYRNIVGTVRTAEMAVCNFCWYELGQRVPDTKVLDEQGQAAGAYVLVPQTGIKQWIACFDINSLYPNTIRTINISPEKIIGQFAECERAWSAIFDESVEPLTFKWERTGQIETKPASEWREYFVREKISVSGYGTAFDQTEEGIIPALLGRWYKERKKYQALAKTSSDPMEVEFADMTQYAMKIKLNSTYGALLNQNFKFYDKRMGQSVTASGRCILLHQIRKGCEIIDGNYHIDPIVDAEEPRALRGEIASPSLIYGDTDSLYCTLSNVLPKNPSLDFVVKVADQIGKEINDSFPAYNRKAFLCQPGFDEHIKTGRELVADRGFYIQKKRYVIHVVDKEGKRKDELKAMGVDMRKTTTPRPVKEFLRKVCYDLLTGKTDKEIDQYIMTYRDAIIDDIPLMELGLPKGVKKVEMYTETFYDDYSTRLPGHVAASILYNETRAEVGDVVSLPITSGMKIKVFNLKYELNHRGRLFNSVALPTDTEILPPWFQEKFVPLIDRELHAKKLVDNMLHNMFDSIPRHVPTRHMEALTEEFEWT
jgi:DNA polymerase elongation subunit (family B)